MEEPVQKVKATLVIDTREKKGWFGDGDDDFAEIKYEKLDTGDYSIQGLESVLCIERKKNVDELLLNFMNNKSRIYAEIDRMQTYKYKFLIIEENLEDVLNPLKYYVNKARKFRGRETVPPAIVIANLITLMVEHNINVIFAGDKGQSIAKRIMLKVYEKNKKSRKKVAD